MSPYDQSFYAKRKGLVKPAAEVIAPVIISLCSPSSVIDVGCGDGSWLAVFRDLGVRHVLGLDGPWTDMDSLQIPAANFRRADLEQPVRIEERFDLAISLEVAEHLSSTRAPGFVDDLTNLSDVVLFSAAIPGQGGTDHLHERWPNYWDEHFTRSRFKKIDTIRQIIWNKPSVPYFYRQNILLFANERVLKIHPNLEAAAAASRDYPLDIVHPELYEHLLEQLSKRVKVKRWVRKLPESWWHAGKKKTIVVAPTERPPAGLSAVYSKN